MLMLWVGLMLAGALLPDVASAQDVTPVSSLKDTGCSQYVGVANRVVTCVRETLKHAMMGDGEGSTSFFTSFYPLVQSMIAGFLTLGIIIYGIMAAYGMLEKISRDVMMLTVKLAFIGFFTLNVNLMYTELMAVMDSLGQAVIGFAPAQEDTETNRQSVCLKEMIEASEANDADYTAPWMSVDCLLDSIIGIKMVDADSIALGGESSEKVGNRLLNGTGLSRGLIAFFFSSMGTSILGLIIAIIGFLFLYSLVFLIAKALFTYLMGYLGLTVLMIVAPIFIPLVLFRKTKEFFDHWVKLLISFTLQPVLVLAFVTFSIMAVDLALFSGEYSVMYRIAGEASKQGGEGTFNLNQYLTDKGAYVKEPRVLAEYRTSRDPIKDFKKDTSGIIEGLAKADCSELAMKNDAELKQRCSEAFPIKKWVDTINWKKLAAARNPAVDDPGAEEGDASTMTAEDRKGRQLSREVLAAVIFATMVVLIMNGLVNIVGVIANGLVGEEFQSPNLVSAVSRSGAFSSSYKKMTAGLDSILKGAKR